MKSAKLPMTVRCAHTELVPIDELRPHPRNPNRHPKKQIQALAKILAHQGWRNPIVVSKLSGFVIAGHGRLMAAKELGWTEAPIDYQDFATRDDEFAHLVADNTLHELSSMDLSLVNLELANLGPDFDLDLLGIDDFVLDPSEWNDLSMDDDKPSNGASVQILECPRCKEHFEKDEAEIVG